MLTNSLRANKMAWKLQSAKAAARGNGDMYASMVNHLMSLDQPTIEVRQPKPGLRHNQGEMLVHHRFPVKDGITSSQLLVRNIEKNNALFAMLRQRQELMGVPKRKSAEEVAQDRINRRLARAQRT